MNRFYLIRHGEKERTAGDPRLTEIGNKQAIITGKHFKNRKIKAVCSSHLKRTIETAKHIASFHNLEIIIDQELRERSNWGDLPGQSLKEFAETWDLCDKDREHIPANGDSSITAGERIEKLLKKIHKEHNDGEIVIVSHGGVIVDFLFNIFSTKLLTKYDQTFMDRKSVIGIRECSITIINFDGEKFELEKLAETSHL